MKIKSLNCQDVEKITIQKKKAATNKGWVVVKCVGGELNEKMVKNVWFLI